MIDLRASLKCSIEDKICSIACKETQYNCIGKPSYHLTEMRITLLNMWRLFDVCLTDAQLMILDCYYEKHFGTKSKVILTDG
jgi:hypothetical protein